MNKWELSSNSLQFRVSSRSLSWQLKAQGGNPAWTGHLPTHSHIHTVTTETSMHLWDVGANPRRHGKSVQTTQTAALTGNRFSYLFVTTKPHYSRTCYIIPVGYKPGRIGPISAKQCSMTFYWTQFAFLWTRLACILRFPQFTSL